ncbi:MAG: hypothetical protein R6V61_11080, partial [Wenzhouxiangellaceae bacterium]
LINGRSMVGNVDIARQLGYLNIPPEQFTDLRELDHLPPEEVLIITTGSQGEPLSALMRGNPSSTVGRGAVPDEFP